MKGLYVASLLFTAISYVACQATTPFYITKPIGGSVFKAGTNETITWINSIDEPVSITVVTGNDPATMTSAGISFTVDGGANSYTWAVPASLASDTKYALQISYAINGTTATSYSTAFSIVGNSVSSAVVASSAVAVSSAAPASSAPASAVTTASARSSAVRSSAVRSSAAASTTPTPSTSGAQSVKVPTLIIAFALVACLFV